MAQVNIAYFAEDTVPLVQRFALACRDAAAKEVHGLKKSEIGPDSVSVMVLPLDRAASLSGADIEVQVLVSGNNWPINRDGQLAKPAEAKLHFDKIARSIHKQLAKQTPRKMYVWVTPFAASGWAE